MGAVAIFSETLPGQLPARSFEQWLLSVCTALVFLPGTPYNAGGSSWFFAALFPAWSLFWELLANFAYGLVVRRLSTRMLALILVGGLVLVAATGVQYGTLDVGPRWGDAPGGAGRVIWGFFAGVALARLASRPSSASLGGPLALLLLAILAWPRGGWVYDFAIVALVFPLMVLLGARTARCSPLGSWLGFTSYGLYVIHVPLLKTVHAIASGTLPMPAMMALSLALVLAVADSLTRHVEVPVRAWLSGIALPRPSGAIPAEACAANGHAKPRQSRVSPQLLTTTSPPVT
jgi:peptidoglycan/LPS O-acetylase OafA/YrhL